VTRPTRRSPRAPSRDELEARIGEQLDESFAFRAPRCDRVVAAVLARLDAGE
jgi:hypothetical protein